MMAAKGDITDDIVLKVAASVGLDIGKIKADMSAVGIDRIIHTNYELADALNIQGTPGFVIGDNLIPGAVDLDTLRAVGIDRTIERHRFQRLAIA